MVASSLRSVCTALSNPVGLALMMSFLVLYLRPSRKYNNLSLSCISWILFKVLLNSVTYSLTVPFCQMVWSFALCFNRPLFILYIEIRASLRLFQFLIGVV